MTTIERVEKAIADTAERLIADPQSTARLQALAALVNARNAMVAADAAAMRVLIDRGAAS